MLKQRMIAFYRRFQLFDKLILGYLIFAPLLFAIMDWRLPVLQKMAVIHPLMILAILALIALGAHLPRSLRWLRYVYPIAGFSFFFGMITKGVNLFLPFWLEPYLIRADIWLYGRHGWQFFSEHLNFVEVEVLAAAYWSYYVLFPMITLMHYARSVRTGNSLAPGQTFDSVMSRLAISLFSCYFLFMVLPARGPHHVFHLSDQHLFTGGFFWHFILMIQGQAKVVGAAFPSAHVAAAWTLYFTLRHDFPKTFWSLLPLLLALTVSVFALQYHFTMDAVAGLLLPILIEAVWCRFFVKRRKNDTTSPPNRDKMLLGKLPRRVTDFVHSSSHE